MIAFWPLERVYRVFESKREYTRIRLIRRLVINARKFIELSPSLLIDRAIYRGMRWKAIDTTSDLEIKKNQLSHMIVNAKV